jgi:hypothetical protein
VFNFYKARMSDLHWNPEIKLFMTNFQVYTVVDEMFLAGEIRETSQTKVGEFI